MIAIIVSLSIAAYLCAGIGGLLALVRMGFVKDEARSDGDAAMMCIVIVLLWPGFCLLYGANQLGKWARK